MKKFICFHQIAWVENRTDELSKFKHNTKNRKNNILAKKIRVEKLNIEFQTTSLFKIHI
jgi:hypothetical protein